MKTTSNAEGRVRSAGKASHEAHNRLFHTPTASPHPTTERDVAITAPAVASQFPAPTASSGAGQFNAECGTGSAELQAAPAALSEVQMLEAEAANNLRIAAELVLAGNRSAARDHVRLALDELNEAELED